MNEFKGMNAAAKFYAESKNNSVKAEEGAYKFYANRLRNGFQAEPPYLSFDTAKKRQVWVVEWLFPNEAITQ